MIIKIPNNNLKERKYILDVLFKEFLGLAFNIEVSSDFEYWQIQLDNQNLLLFKDCFFNNFKKEKSYLTTSNIPDNVTYISNDFLIKKDIPVLYGDNTLNIERNKIISGIDIFASSFFMLTRWEESVIKNKDKHDRFSAYESLAYKNNFLQRAVVNEYLEMLKKMLLFLDSSIVFKNTEKKQYVSCDVDTPFDSTLKNTESLLRACSGDILKRKNFKQAIKRIKAYRYSKKGNYQLDTNYTFNWYMDVCEENNLKCAFYFIPDNKEKGNGNYSYTEKRIKDLLKLVNNRGHEIGVHGSYQTFRDFNKTISQKKKLEEHLTELKIEQSINGNRQHYLRWDSEVTASNLNKAGFVYDTTGGYADVSGFRYGVCYEFSMFDFIKREKLNLKQRPLIVMECSVIGDMYMGLGTGEKGYLKMKELKDECYKYNGNFTILWHNSYFSTQEHKALFQRILKY